MLKYMEALLKRTCHYQIKLVDQVIHPMKLIDLLEVSFSWEPDLIIVFSTTQDYDITLRYAARMKAASQAVIICVGEGANTNRKNYSFKDSPIDIALPGEAELELLNVIKEISGGRSIKELSDFYLRSNQLNISQLDELPFPECSFEELKKYHHIYPIRLNKRLVWGHVLSSRGCPYPCMFCTEMIRETIGTESRLRSAKNIVDEIQLLMEKGVNIIIFDDDNLTTHKGHVEKLCHEILMRKLNIRWVAHARVDNVSVQLLKTMKRAGCVLLRFGVESGSQRILKILDKTHGNNWIKQTKEAFESCRKLGIATTGLFMIGSPTETKKCIEETIALAKKIDPDIIQVSFFTYYPDTKVTKKMDKDNDFTATHMNHFTTPKSDHNPSQLDIEELNHMQKLFYKKLLLNPKFIIRHFFQYSIFYMYNPLIFRSLFGITRYLGNENSKQRRNKSFK